MMAYYDTSESSFPGLQIAMGGGDVRTSLEGREPPHPTCSLEKRSSPAALRKRVS